MRTLMIISLALLSLVAQATVYKWVDKDGKVHYSDEPNPQAQAVEFTDKTQNQISLETPKPLPDPIEVEQVGYALKILSPQHEETIRDNAGDFQVQVEVEPELASGHFLQLYIDGISSSDAQRSNLFQLKNIDRGEHTLQLKAVQQNGKVLASSSPITIFLHQAGLMQPAFPAPGKGPKPSN